MKILLCESIVQHEYIFVFFSFRWTKTFILHCAQSSLSFPHFLYFVETQNSDAKLSGKTKADIAFVITKYMYLLKFLHGLLETLRIQCLGLAAFPQRRSFDFFDDSTPRPTTMDAFHCSFSRSWRLRKRTNRKKQISGENRQTRTKSTICFQWSLGWRLNIAQRRRPSVIGAWHN